MHLPLQKGDLQNIAFWTVVYTVITPLMWWLVAREGINMYIFAYYRVISMFLVIWVAFLERFRFYGFWWAENRKRALWYLPLLPILSAPFWFGAVPAYSVPDASVRVGTIVFAAFMEELCFRGFLFLPVAAWNRKWGYGLSALSVILPAAVFFMGILGEPVSVFLHLCGAAAVGILLTALYEKTKCIFPGIVLHSLYWSFCLFSAPAPSLTAEALRQCGVIFLCLWYSWHLLKK